MSSVHATDLIQGKFIMITPDVLLAVNEAGAPPTNTLIRALAHSLTLSFNSLLFTSQYFAKDHFYVGLSDPLILSDGV